MKCVECGADRAVSCGVDCVVCRGGDFEIQLLPLDLEAEYTVDQMEEAEAEVMALIDNRVGLFEFQEEGAVI